MALAPSTLAKKRKIRADFRKNRVARTRSGDWTRQLASGRLDPHDVERDERVSGKGSLSRRRTVVGEESADGHFQLEVDEQATLPGLVLSVHGLYSQVEAQDGRVFRCATRRVLKTLATDERHVVVAGDRVRFRPEGADEGLIERVEPRRGVMARTSRGRQHLLVSNIDQLVIVASAAQPELKPHLIDRMLVSAEQAGIEALICINKIELVDAAALQPLVGVYSQLGYRVLLTSAVEGRGVARLRQAVVGRASAVAGQSGVGKSSLLNAVEPGLGLRVQEVSEETEKGKHTTTSARLIPLAAGGHVVDTPGIRQFQLWDVIPQEAAACFRELRPWVSYCRYPNCSHTVEDDCAVKDAVADDLIDVRRYESYQHIYHGDQA